MPDMPAICDRCGAVFGSGFWIDNSTEISLTDMQAGPCPVCGAMGHIPDGTYDVIGKHITAIAHRPNAAARMAAIAEAIEKARATGASPREAAEAVREVAPDETGLIDLLLSAKAGTLYALLALLLTALLAVQAQFKPDGGIDPDELQAALKSAVVSAAQEMRPAEPQQVQGSNRPAERRDVNPAGDRRAREKQAQARKREARRRAKQARRRNR